MTSSEPLDLRAAAIAAVATAASLVTYEMVLARLLAVVVFADTAHVALAAAMLGISAGALAVHLGPPTVDARDRVALGLVAQAVLTVGAVAFAVFAPVVRASEETTWYARESQRFGLLDPLWFVALLFVVAAPPAASGALLTTAFRRLPAALPRVYAADLVGGGLAAAAFLPLAGVVRAPDLVFLASGMAALGAFFVAVGPGRVAAAGVGAAALAGALAAAVGPVFPIHHAAGWDESHVRAERWTSVARLGLYEGPADQAIDGTYLVIDNASASLVVRDAATAARLAAMANRGAVYALHRDDPRPVAVLAAGAGPEVAVALAAGRADVLAIELDPAMFSLVRSAYPGQTPFDRAGVRTMALDARAALRQEPGPYGVIQLVQANFFGAAGALSYAWSPHLLYTVEAIGGYLDRLAQGGTLAISSFEPDVLFATARLAARKSGLQPDASVVLLRGPAAVVLVRRGAFSGRDLALLAALPDVTVERDAPRGARVLTADHPYADRIGDLGPLRTGQLGVLSATVHRAMWIQGLGVLGAAALLLGLPWLVRGRGQASARALGFAGAVGYGWFTLEIALVNRLATYVGHPSAAFPLVLATMLVGSGIGSLWIGARAVAPRVALAAVGLVAAATLWGVLPALEAWAFAPSPAVRAACGIAALLPLSVLLGAPFPLGLLRLGDGGRAVPWMWAVNGWGSVAATVGTLFVVRFFGYNAAFGTALAAYAVAFWLVGGAAGHARPVEEAGEGAVP